MWYVAVVAGSEDGRGINQWIRGAAAKLCEAEGQPGWIT